MTPEELSEIYYTNKEIKRIQKDIENLKSKNFYKPNIITDMPRGGGGKDSFAEYAEDMKTLEDMLRYSLKKLQIKRAEAETFLETITDPQTRLIMRLRTVNNMKWEDIARETNMDRRTASRKFYAYFQNCPQCDTNL